MTFSMQAHTNPAFQGGCWFSIRWWLHQADGMPIERWSVISRNGEAGWCGRRKHQVVSHRGSLFLLGGYTSGGVIGAGRGPNANLHDVWKSTEGAVRMRSITACSFGLFALCMLSVAVCGEGGCDNPAGREFVRTSQARVEESGGRFEYLEARVFYSLD